MMFAISIGTRRDNTDTFPFYIAEIVPRKVKGDVLYDADTPLINERIILDTFAEKGLIRKVDVEGDICFFFLLSHGLFLGLFGDGR